jgi:hypothetical protein
MLSDSTRLWTFKELDGLYQRPKGTAFRVFKRLEKSLREGEHYHYLNAQTHSAEIARLRQAGRIYTASVNVVLLTEAGYRLLEPKL